MKNSCHKLLSHNKIEDTDFNIINNNKTYLITVASSRMRELPFVFCLKTISFANTLVKLSNNFTIFQYSNIDTRIPMQSIYDIILSGWKTEMRLLAHN